MTLDIVVNFLKPMTDVKKKKIKPLKVKKNNIISQLWISYKTSVIIMNQLLKSLRFYEKNLHVSRAQHIFITHTKYLIVLLWEFW